MEGPMAETSHQLVHGVFSYGCDYTNKCSCASHPYTLQDWWTTVLLFSVGYLVAGRRGVVFMLLGVRSSYVRLHFFIVLPRWLFTHAVG